MEFWVFSWGSLGDQMDIIFLMENKLFLCFAYNFEKENVKGSIVTNKGKNIDSISKVDLILLTKIALVFNLNLHPTTLGP